MFSRSDIFEILERKKVEKRILSREIEILSQVFERNPKTLTPLQDSLMNWAVYEILRHDEISDDTFYDEHN